MKPLGRGDPRKLGPYSIEQVIGSGGMGRVYLGRSASGQYAAVKVMSHLGDPKASARFRREFDLARTVRSPYLAEVLDSGSHEDTLWYASEYVPGPTLRDVIDQTGGRGLGESAATTIALALCEVLALIHARGITHRDLKPANIIISATGPRVIDFGIAHLHGRTVTTSGAMGSIGYIAPERYASGDPQASWDTFALGIVVAYAASGRMPFASRTFEENYHAVTSLPPMLDGVPQSLLPFVQLCLSKDPSVRSDIGVARRELDGAQTGTVHGLRWLPDDIATEVLRQTKVLPAQLTKRSPKLTRPSSPARKESRAGGRTIAALLLVGLLGMGLVKLGPGLWDDLAQARGKAAQGRPTPRQSVPPADPTSPPLPKFTVGARAKGKAYTRPTSSSSLTVTKVEQRKLNLYVSVQVRGYPDEGHPFDDTCVRIKGSQWSGTKHVYNFGLDGEWNPHDQPAVRRATLIFSLGIAGEYILLDRCDPKRSTGVLLGRNAVTNRGILRYDGWIIPVLKTYRAGKDVGVSLSHDRSPMMDYMMCLRTAKGLIATARDENAWGPTGPLTDDDYSYRLITFANAPKGGRLYLTSCDELKSYNGTTVTLP